jgi:hypothetical protein
VQGLTLKFTFGSGAAEVFTLSDGETLLVGASDEADVEVEDTFLSGRHFRIEQSETGWQVVDLDSTNGTYVDGVQVPRRELREGTRILAGHLEVKVSLGIRQDTPQQFLRDYLREQPGWLYALVDAANGAPAREFLLRTEGLHQSLFEGESGERLSEAAPYLVGIDINDPVLDVLIYDSWRQGWCTFVVSNAPFEMLRMKLRGLLLVEEDDEASVVYFRFYDPRVLRNFVPECDDEQLEELFEVVESFVVESPETDEVLRFRRVNGELETEVVDLSVDPVKEDTEPAAV